MSTERKPTLNERIFRVMFETGNVSMSVDAIRLRLGLGFAEVHEALLLLHRQGHVNGRSFEGLVIPVEKKIPSGDLFEDLETVRKERKGTKKRSSSE